jgi:hypothetical protein
LGNYRITLFHGGVAMNNNGLNWLVCILIQCLIAEVDKGVKYSVEEVRENIDKANIISWIEKELPDVELSNFKNHPERIQLFHTTLEAYYNLHGHKTRGIFNNGLCYLISILTELIDNLDEKNN